MSHIYIQQTHAILLTKGKARLASDLSLWLLQQYRNIILLTAVFICASAAHRLRIKQTLWDWSSREAYGFIPPKKSHLNFKKTQRQN